MRAGGAGIGAFYTPTGYGTLIAEGKETRAIDGRNYVLEYPIRGDVALVKALRGDRWGNLVYRKTARNFGPIMATAAKMTIVEVEEIVELGALDPEAIVTPGIYVDRLVEVERSRGMMKLDRKELAKRVARDIPDGAYVNLGIGLPTLMADYLPPDREIVLHSENGLLGMGPQPDGRACRSGSHQRRQAAGDCSARRILFPSRQFLRHDARPPYRYLRARRLPGVRERRPCQLAHGRRTRSLRSAARWTWPSAPSRFL